MLAPVLNDILFIKWTFFQPSRSRQLKNNNVRGENKIRKNR